jgi:hypothetical protein
MNSRVRALRFVAPVLAIGGVIFILSRSDPKPASQVPEEAAGASSGEVVRAAAEPSKPREPDTRDGVAGPAEPALPAVVATPTEDSLAAAMHALEDASPERALDLARQGQALWPSGARAPEFAATEVKCLYRLGKPSEGRGAAETMVNKYPTSPWALEVEKQTGAHPYIQH